MAISSSELFLIRHAPSAIAGHLFGRTDVAADPLALADVVRLREAIAPAQSLLSSPALRCRQTAEILRPEGFDIDDRLREQDFGDWDGLPFSEVPDLGPLAPDELAAHRPPNGESFDDLCRRVWPAVRDLAAKGRSTVIVAHAGTIRATLALALRTASPALAFEVAPLAMTRLRCLPPNDFAIACTNCPTP